MNAFRSLFLLAVAAAALVSAEVETTNTDAAAAADVDDFPGHGREHGHWGGREGDRCRFDGQCQRWLRCSRRRGICVRPRHPFEGETSEANVQEAGAADEADVDAVIPFRPGGPGARCGPRHPCHRHLRCSRRTHRCVRPRHPFEEETSEANVEEAGAEEEADVDTVILPGRPLPIRPGGPGARCGPRHPCHRGLRCSRRTNRCVRPRHPFEEETSEANVEEAGAEEEADAEKADTDALIDIGIGFGHGHGHRGGEGSRCRFDAHCHRGLHCSRRRHVCTRRRHHLEADEQ
jgi:hypothetical protein